MPVDRVFHIGNALALNGFCNYRNGLIYGFCHIKRGLYFVKIVAVYCDSVPAERLKLFIDRSGGVNLFDSSVYLKIVVIDKRSEV